MQQKKRDPYEEGRQIIKELLTSERFEAWTRTRSKNGMGHKKQLTTIGLLGDMEEGKTALKNQLNVWSDAPIKISMDDQSRLKLKQDEIDEYTRIRHIWINQRILFLYAAHRFRLLPKDIRAMLKAIIWVSLPPPWEIEDCVFLDQLFSRYNIEIPDEPYTAIILWRDWVKRKWIRWGWVLWEPVEVTEVEWTQEGFFGEPAGLRVRADVLEVPKLKTR